MTCAQNVHINPMHTDALGKGLMSFTLNAMLNTAATTNPTALAFKPGNARLYTSHLRNLPQNGNTAKINITPGPNRPNQQHMTPTMTLVTR